MSSDEQTKNIYGQYCPLAMSAEFLCTRWTMLVLRELLFGSTSFNDISRGVPRMSRTLLSTRLKELIEAGVVKKEELEQGQVHYRLTEAGHAFKPVVLGMAGWGQQWLKVGPSLRELDVGLLMWDIRRNTQPLKVLPNPFVVEFYLTDVPENKKHHWLVFKDDEVDLCHIDYGFDVDVLIEVSVQKLTKVWMGWENMQEAIETGAMRLKGNTQYTDIATEWLGHSSVAKIPKVPVEARI